MKKNTKEQTLDIAMDSDATVNDAYLNGMDAAGTTGQEEEDDTTGMLRHPNRNPNKKSNGQAPPKSVSRQNKLNDTLVDPVVAEALPAVLSKELFSELAAVRGRCCISLYMAVQAGNEEANIAKNITRYKQQLQELTSALRTQGFEEEYIQQLLQPARDLAGTEGLWNTAFQGLGVFLSDGYCRYIPMPLAPLEEHMINSEFLITPLVTLMETNEYFYLLAISKRSAKLFKGDEWGMKIVPLELPQNLEEARGLNTTGNVSARRAKKRAQTTEENSAETTAGTESNFIDKNDILGYFEAVDDALWDQVLNKENAPLVLAAVEYEIPIYKNACDYHNVWPQALTGNRDQQETASLFEDAKQVIQPYFDKKMVRALEQYANNSATALTSSQFAEIVPAAYYARVSHLFVCRGARTWGSFDQMNNELTVMQDHEEGAENLVNSAVIQTISNGGSVFLLERDQMPDGSDLAAIMRF